jgi:Ca-activated chloride channel family protein
MLRLFFIVIAFFQAGLLSAQHFYFRGLVRDEKEVILPNVRIVQQSTGMVFRSGAEGTFGIPSTTARDSFFFYLEGFAPAAASWSPDKQGQITLSRIPDTRPKYTYSSLTLGWNRQDTRRWFTGNETYADLLENRFLDANLFPSTAFSLNIDRASYSNIRRFIKQRSRVPVDAVRIEEMLNYFNLGYRTPEADKVFQVNSRMTDCPWDASSRLLFIQSNARSLDLNLLPPAHFTFLIDVSASMDEPNRLPLLQSAFRLLIGHLREKDSVAIVTYGGVTGVRLYTTSGNQKDSIRRVIDSLYASGATPGESGLRLAYSVARRHYIPGGNNRVILATDGDFNVGIKSEEELEALIAGESKKGIYLTCLGVGMGNYKDSKIQSLAKRGNGNFAYLDGVQEAEKVLFNEFAKTLYSVADEATLSAQFNPSRVKEYRLIGFDNKMGAYRDSTARLKGGEIGTGQSAWAIFQLRMNENENPTEGLAKISLDYRIPNDTVWKRQEEWIRPGWEALSVVDTTYRFATSLAWFGSLLRQSGHVPQKSWEALLKFLPTAVPSGDLHQQEFDQIVRAAYEVYYPRKKKKRKSEDED